MSHKFSIITCTWNSAATLQQTLDSVAMQGGCEIEHIFVDGGSTDGTLDLIARYGGAAAVLENVRGGISRAMNEGARIATGNVIAHLHSDDYFASPETLSRVSTTLADSGRRWLVGRTATLIDGVLHPPLPQKPFSPSRYRSRGFFIAHPATFVERALFEAAGGFDEKLRYAMDIDLWLRLIAQESPAVLDETLTVFREHPGSLSTAQRTKARQEELRVRLADRNTRVVEKAAMLLRMIKTAKLLAAWS